MKELTLNELSQLITKTHDGVDELKRLFQENVNKTAACSTVLLTTKELCSALHVSKSTLAKLVKQGMPTLRIGDSLRYSLNECIAFIQSKNKENQKTGP